MQRQKLTLPDDGPLVVKLDFGPEGVEYPSKFGKGLEYMYTVNDDAGVLFLKPDARNAIISSGAQAGDEIAICKRHSGNRLIYDVRLVPDSQEYPPAPPARRPAPQPIPVRQSQPAPAQRSTPASSSPGSVYPIMDRCLKAAAQQVKETCDYAASIGLVIEGGVTFEDIRTLGITLFIKEQSR